MSPPERRGLRLHGHPVAYYAAGSGPVILLIHGITSSADAWRRVIPALAERHTVIAPDLLGHGGSAKPRGDYSLGAYASGLRDLMAALGHPRVWLEIDDKGFVDCGYCDRRFVLQADPHERGRKEVMPGELPELRDGPVDEK